ncbi:MAG: tetratricopeptide repeat protein, partial [Deltaproteobacteria bacterium]|nr:tetratricopeptide repeat protein [Deltaproteobacteria bacterium]
MQKLSPPPSIPEEATRFSVRGEVAIKEAKSTADFGEAAKEFSKAVRVAPWWADGYINLAVAQEKAGQLSEAIRSLKLYLLASPASPDTDKVKRQIYALEYRQERAGKDAVAKGEEQERKRREEENQRRQQAMLISGLAGAWQTSNSRFQVSVSGKSILITKTATWSPPDRVWIPVEGDPPRYGRQFGLQFRGEIEGFSIRGVSEVDWRPTWRNGEIFTRSMTGTISPDGRRIVTSGSDHAARVWNAA